MNPALKSILIIAAKNAVNALLTNTGLWLMDNGVYNFSHSGIVHMLKAGGMVILSRESMIWLPKIIKWSTT